jgi:2-deoxy-D-gluconate 3-dehydrogenase
MNAAIGCTDLSMFDLSSRVAVVTGGNGGIGLAISLAMAKAGASVAIVARNEEKSRQAIKELTEIGRPCVSVRADVRSREQLTEAVAEIEATLGSIDVLVNNAAVVIPSHGVLNESDENWDTVLATNLGAVFALSRLVGKSMAARMRGKVINIGSLFSLFGSATVPSYSAAKGGVIQLTKSMAIDFARYNIQVNAIAPGWIETEMSTEARSSPLAVEILARTPAKRWGQPADIAGAAVFLASDAANFITGATLIVDGGYSIY